MSETMEPVEGGAPKAARRSKMAVAGFILTLIPLLGFTSIVGMTLGIVGVIQISRSEGRLKGKGLAVAAIVIGALGLMVLPVITMVGMGYLMMSPALDSAREQARRTACMNNLNQLSIALESYANDHDNLFPSTDMAADSAGSLALLYPDYIPDTRIFVCPSDLNSGPSGTIPWPLTNANCSYTYDNTVKYGETPSDTMLVWSKSLETHEHGRNVLFGDGHVQWLIEDEFQEKLVEQRAGGEAAGIVNSE